MFALLLTTALMAEPQVLLDVDVVRYRTQSNQWVFSYAEQPKYETRRTSGYLPGACNCPMCRALRSKEYKVCVNTPTPLSEIEQVLREAKLTADDVLYDLGCSDGRVCVLASREFGCRSVGLDLRPEAVELAQRNAKLNGVARLTRFYKADATRSDLSQATVVYAYLPQDVMVRCAAKFSRYNRLRLAISYRHAWKDGRATRWGQFHLWRPRPAVVAPSRSPAAPARGLFLFRSRCAGGTCR